MKIGAAISQIKVDNKIMSDDIVITNRYIWNKIRDYTLFFLKQRNDRFNLNNNNFIYSTLGCVEMELVNSIDCCTELPACKILRSKKPLPKIAESNMSSVVKGIFTLDTSQRIDFVTINDVVRAFKSMYKPQNIMAFIKNGYLYIPFRETPKAVLIEAFFEDPLEVYHFNECSATNYCVSMQEMEWKAPSDLRGVILQEVNKDIFNFQHKLISDENTNKNENIR